MSQYTSPKKGKFPDPLPRNPFRPELTVKDSCTGKVPDRVSYGGYFKDGKFYKNTKSVDRLNPRTAAAILAEMEAEREQKLSYFSTRVQDYEIRQKVRDVEKKQRRKERLTEFQKSEELKNADRGEKLKKWLELKEEQARQKKRDMERAV